MTAPTPPVPSDVDLRGLPFMPLDTVRLLDSDMVALSTGDEFKAALTLWCKAWQQVPAASLPNDDRILAHLSGTSQRWKKVKARAMHGFVLCSDGRLYHPVIAEKALEAWKHRRAQKANAAKRWEGHSTESGDATGHATGHATAYPTGQPTAMQVKLSEVKESLKTTPLVSVPTDGEKLSTDDPEQKVNGAVLNTGRSTAKAKGKSTHWSASEVGIAATGKTFGIEKRPNEMPKDYADRVWSAVNANVAKAKAQVKPRGAA